MFPYDLAEVISCPWICFISPLILGKLHFPIQFYFIKNGDDDAEFTHYDAKFDFSINEDYTYSKYKILNIDVENIDHDIDNTRHFS